MTEMPSPTARVSVPLGGGEYLAVSPVVRAQILEGYVGTAGHGRAANHAVDDLGGLGAGDAGVRVEVRAVPSVDPAVRGGGGARRGGRDSALPARDPRRSARRENFTKNYRISQRNRL